MSLRVSISEYGQLEGLDVEFQPGLNIITGENGSGKSSLLEAILWAIYGDSRIRMASANVESNINDVTAIRNTSNGKSGITMRVGSEEFHAIREAAAALEASGFPTLDVLKSTIWSSQGQLGYISLTPTERRKFLSGILELEEWENSRARVKVAIGRLAAEAARITSKIEVLRENIAESEEWIEGLRPDAELAETQPQPEPPPSVDEAEIARLESKTTELERELSQEPELQRELSQLSIEDTGALFKLFNELTEQKQALIEQQQQRQSLLARLQSLRRNAETLNSIPCAATDFPKTCRFVSDAYLAREEIPVVEESLERTNGEVNSRITELDVQIREVKGKHTEATLLRNTAERLSKRLGRMEDARQQLYEARERLEALRALQAATGGLREAYKAWEDSNTALKFMRKAQEQLEANQKEVGELTVTLESLNSRVNRLSIIERDFSPKGVPGYLVEMALPELAESTNAFLAQFNDDYRVRFSMVKMKVTGGVSETLDILVSEGGDERPVEACSGGERVLIDISVRLALKQFMESRGYKLPNFLVLDETLAPLDEGNRSRFIEALLGMTGVERIILVSHVPDLRELPGNVIEL